MKGISPLIAVVLLVAFTVAVGGILMLWFTTMTRTTTTGTQSQSQAIIKCSNAGFDILSVDPSNNKIIVTHFGSGLTLYPMHVTFSDGTVMTVSSSNTNPTSIASGGIATINATISSNTSVKVTALCEYGTVNVTVDDTCTTPEECWKS